jgi:ABC-type lipoprotein export system ATPase subunit
MMEYGPVAHQLAEQFDWTLKPIEPFKPFDLSEVITDSFRLGLIVGPSGSGKSQTLRSLGEIVTVVWDPEWCVADHFASADEAVTCLGAAGLNSVPQWMKPHHILSNGEQHRADIALICRDAAGLTLIDEYTSVVDRTVAMSLSYALDRFLQADARFVLATCHYDVLEWMQPDWVLDTATGDIRLSSGNIRKPVWTQWVGTKVGSITRD